MASSGPRNRVQDGVPQRQGAAVTAKTVQARHCWKCTSGRRRTQVSLLAPSWLLLEPSWLHLGYILGHLGSIFGPWVGLGKRFLHYLLALRCKNRVFACRVRISVGAVMHTLHTKTLFLQQSAGRSCTKPVILWNGTSETLENATKVHFLAKDSYSFRF